MLVALQEIVRKPLPGQSERKALARLMVTHKAHYASMGAVSVEEKAADSAIGALQIARRAELKYHRDELSWMEAMVARLAGEDSGEDDTEEGDGDEL